MNSKLLFVAAALALLVALISTILLEGMYDVNHHNWRPHLSLEEWNRAWRARRDLYMWSAVLSFLAACAFVVAGGWLQGRRLTRRPSRPE